MHQSRFRKFLKAVGPGFITGSADDDPSGIATYSQTGAQFGYTQLWFVLFVMPFMIAIQEMCGRIGLVTGSGLSGVIRKHYSKPLLYCAVATLLIANTINIGADLGAMASSAELVLGLPYIFWLIGMTALIIFLEVFVAYRTYVKVLKYLCFSLFAYIIAAFSVTQPWGEILRSLFVPFFSFSKEYLFNLVALFGTTISPYLFFWQSDEEVEEEILHHQIRDFGTGMPHVSSRTMHEMRLDTSMGMFFSNLITFFIITTTASTLGANGIRTVATATEAAEALQPLAGPFASLLFAAGVIGTGLLGVPILAASASYAISEAVGWKPGLFRTFKQAPGFYLVIVLSTVVGLTVNLLGVPSFTMLYYAAVLNGIMAPPLMMFILLVANNRAIMGRNTNGWFSNVAGFILTMAMSIAAAALIVMLF
ncbi:MAG: divalent metal cation transporter [Candidatus Peribacteraceae bacterium]|nr:divalent metal cation transporter [Candidatus Peribacteraceae bacterium]MDD5074950.1 divalent metal cation transporter [Candidatus Peribacteraceae bacterium]